MKSQIHKKNSIANPKKNGSTFFIIIAFLFPVLLYLHTINFGFTSSDDEGIISNNITFLSNFGNAPKAFLTDAFVGKNCSFYRPLQTLTYMIDIQLSNGGGGGGLYMFHLSNILLIGLISIILFLFLRKLLIPSKLAILSTLIFCSNPLFVSFVSWVPSRGDILLSLFSLLTFWSFIEFLETRKINYLILNWLFFTIALFCKETAAVFPFLIILYYYLFYFKKRIDKKILLIIILYFISGLFWFWLRSKSISYNSNSSDYKFGLTPLLLNLKTIPESLAIFFFPFNLNPMPVYSFVKTLTGLVIICFIIFIFYKNKEKTNQEKLFFLTWFLLLLLPPMLYKVPTVDYLEHRLFLPLIGILIFLLFIFPKKWIEKGDIKSTWLLISFVIFLSIFTFYKSHFYSDQKSYCDLLVSENPKSNLVYIARGIVKLNQNDFQGAVDDFNISISLDSTYEDSYYNIALAYSRIGNYGDALKNYNRTIAINPKHEFAFNNRGYLKSTKGDFKGALDDYNNAIALCPTYEMAYINRGLLKLNNLGDNSGAILDFNYIVSNIKKNNVGFYGRVSDAYYNIGVANMHLGKFKLSIENFNNSIAICSTYVQAYGNRGISKLNIGDKLGALDDFNKAIELKPDYIDTYVNRAIVKDNLNDLTGSLEDCQKVLNINPNYEKILRLKATVQQDIQKLKL